MSEEIQDQSVDTPATESRLLRNLLIGLAMAYVIVSAYFIVDSHARVEQLEAAQKSAVAENAQLLKRLGVTESALKQSQETLAGKLGMTQKEIANRAAALQRQQREAEERLSQETKQQVGAVTGEVAGVKTELGGAKTDIASTRSDLEATTS